MINSLRAVTENQIRAHLNISDDEFEKLRNPAPEHLHDPSLYMDMGRIVAYLHEEKMRQESDIQKVLASFADYDADGICSEAIITASLDVFNIRHITGVPSMDDGYGLCKAAVDQMMEKARKAGLKIDMILTADNGIRAHDGVNYAAENGITVVVTDHHLTGPELPQGAKVCIDPWKKGDTYPFKHNSGATVVWKVMLEYAKIHEPEKLPLIEQLIVLAGISNVADVMHITDENRYMVVRAMEILNKIRKEPDYNKIADTPYLQYNAVFWGLHDLVALLQVSKDAKRAEKGKGPVPLPYNEELISWYIGPMLNSARRVHGTCLEAMASLLVTDHACRQDMVQKLIELNTMKSGFRDKVLGAVGKEDDSPMICVNTRHGISGLIAGRLAENREMPSIVFARRDDGSETVVYDKVPEDGKLTASARSSEICPLDKVIDMVNRRYPGMIKGGGHATAAGITIEAKDYGKLKEILPGICQDIISQNKDTGVAVPPNVVRVRCNGSNLSAAYHRVNEEGMLEEHTDLLDPKLFESDVKDTYKFLESLRPYGEGFHADTRFEFEFDPAVCSNPAMKWNPAFWKTFKFNVYGVECLTFNEDWADDVKHKLAKGESIVASAVIKMNVFRGVITPQLQLSPL